jgi:hypothetical protein
MWKYEKVTLVLKKYEEVCVKLIVAIWNLILRQPMRLIQKISSCSDVQKSKQKKCSYIAVAEIK